MKNEFDSRQIYCRRLGHEVPFSYCRIAREGLPCERVRSCWADRFDINRYIIQNFTTTERSAMDAPVPDRLETILDIVKKYGPNK